mmetsp:Transcript_20439/g.59720  ORF Transcript_20439/g.59720 Transcript_20439/m.59720 type:complete len:254 (+) Transcript_20439:124-885(+)
MCFIRATGSSGLRPTWSSSTTRCAMNLSKGARQPLHTANSMRKSSSPQTLTMHATLKSSLAAQWRPPLMSIPSRGGSSGSWRVYSTASNSLHLGSLPQQRAGSWPATSKHSVPGSYWRRSSISATASCLLPRSHIFTTSSPAAWTSLHGYMCGWTARTVGTASCLGSVRKSSRPADFLRESSSSRRQGAAKALRGRRRRRAVIGCPPDRRSQTHSRSSRDRLARTAPSATLPHHLRTCHCQPCRPSYNDTARI